MKIGVLTGNQPRHLALLKALSAIGDVYAVQECTTVFPGQVDDFFRKSPVMQAYFSHVIRAEEKVFGTVGFLPSNVRTLSVKAGDLNGLSATTLKDLLSCDRFVVFGASYIKGFLIEALIEKAAINIHMGVSPFYRGSSCNFWALYDGNRHLVGATLHLLSKGLDSGDILFHAFPSDTTAMPFDLGMLAVRAAQNSLVEYLEKGSVYPPVPQDKSRQIRYTRNADFTDAVAAEYLERLEGIPVSTALDLPARPDGLVRPVWD